MVEGGGLNRYLTPKLCPQLVLCDVDWVPITLAAPTVSFDMAVDTSKDF